MKLTEMICPRCGAHLKVREDVKRFKCEHCGTTLLVDDEVQHIQYDNAEDAGYQFEKGRQRAQREADYTSQKRTSSGNSRKKKKKSTTWLWVLGWLFIFPLPLTILMLRNRKLRPAIRYGIIAVSWAVYLFLGMVWNKDNTNGDNTAQNASASAQRSSLTSSTSTEKVSAAGLARTEAPSIAIQSLAVQVEETKMVIGQKTKAQVDVFPDNATNKAVIWASSDPAVVTVDNNGNIRTVGGGTATITTTAENGVTSSIAISVDGKKRLMTLNTVPVRENTDVNIGNEWDYEFQIDGKDVYWEREYIVPLGKKLNFYAKCTESDEKPDVGDAKGTRTISQQDFDQGFTAQLNVKVKENGGKNAGKVAKFTMQFIFTPVE